MDQLHAHLSKFNTAPFLFVGSGISKRYIESEGWQELLENYANALGKPFQYYQSKSNGGLDAVASSIAHDYNDYWWSSDVAQKPEDILHAMGPSSALKIDISHHLDALLSRFITNNINDAELLAFKQVNVDGIITTNYDRLLESIFPDFRVFIGQDQLLFSTQQGVAEIYKIHGCTSAPNSIVITEEDYSEYTTKNPYLASKLITIFIEHPVIFLGYSLGDRNIQQMLDSICKCMTNNNISDLQDRLIFVEYAKGLQTPRMETSSIKIGNRNPLPIYRIFADSLIPIYEALSNLQRKFPARLLRQLKEQVYELVHTTNPKCRLYVKDIEHADKTLSNCEVVFGVGAIDAVKSIGLRGLNRNDLINDVILNNRDFPAEGIITETLPSIFINAIKYCPIFKYLRHADYLDEQGKLRTNKILPPKIQQHFSVSHTAFIFAGSRLAGIRKKQQMFPDFKLFLKRTSPEDALLLIPGFTFDFVPLDSLNDFLQKNVNLLKSRSTDFSRLVCLYDYRKFRLMR